MRSSLRFVAIAAFAVIGAGSANAQTATQDITITATVTKACTVNNAVAGSTVSVNIPVTLAGAVTTTGITPAAFANVVCNAPSNLQLTSLLGGVRENLAAGAAAPSGFTNIINYTASATWGGATATLDTTLPATATGPEAGALAPIAAANAGSLSVTINPLPNTSPLVIGGYADTLRVSIIPQ